VPPVSVPPDAAALDLDHDDADVRHEHDEVGLVVLRRVGDPEVRQEHGLGRQRVAESLPDEPLRRSGELRSLRHQSYAVTGHDPSPESRRHRVARMSATA
jgi:hypothetical protein